MAYVMVDCISQFRMRYAVQVPDHLSEKEQLEWAQDTVTCEEAEEFSQFHLGEVISSARTLSKEDLLSTFKQDNDYLSSWSEDQILNYVCKIDEEGKVLNPRHF